jgi:hypothetical protein
MKRPDLPTDHPAGRVLDAELHLLDRQVLDQAGAEVCVVDDLEVTDCDEPRLARLLTGPTIGTRIFGGRPPHSRLDGVQWHDVVDVDVTITSSVHADELDVTWRERWLRDHVIAHIPGGRRDRH